MILALNSQAWLTIQVQNIFLFLYNQNTSDSIDDDADANKLIFCPRVTEMTVLVLVIVGELFQFVTERPHYNELEGTAKSPLRLNRVRYNRIFCSSAYVWVQCSMRRIVSREYFN